MRVSRLLSLVLSAAMVLMLAPAALAGPSTTRAAGTPASGAIPGRYIVTLVDGADPAAVAREYRGRGAGVDRVYGAALRGFAGDIPPALVDRLRADDRVLRVEADGWVREAAVQSSPTWGLDRIDQRDLPLSKSYETGNGGAGVTVYVLDTGIRATHVDMAGRVAAGFTAVHDGVGADDCRGHGTHVAGTIGGTTWGVAKNVTLVPVRVLNCEGSGSWSGVIAGIDWVTKVAPEAAVANMSLGGGANSSVDTAVRNSIAAGVVYTLAAGNNTAADACTRSPARVGEGLTVGATTSSDARASYSNIGTCLDLFAPGSSVKSAGITSDTATATMSGTSMATPHVAGVAALLLAGAPSTSVADINASVVGNATPGKVADEGAGSPDLLLHSVFAVAEPIAPTEPTEPTPVAAPGTPAGFAAVAASSSRIDLSWQDVEGEDGYTLSLVTVDAAGTTVRTTVAQLPADATRHAHEGLTAGTLHRYELTATNTGGTSAAANASATTAELVSTTPTTGISLTATGSKVKGAKQTDLRWSGATSTSVDVFRDGTRIVTTANDGAHLDQLNTKGGGSHTYKVCEAGTTTCSPEAVVSF